MHISFPCPVCDAWIVAQQTAYKGDMSQMLETKRATRGLRMAELVGEAADDDEQFWNADIWNEDEDGSDAESFVEEDEEVKPDEFDSDFNDTETEEESGSDDEGNMRKTARAQKVSNYCCAASLCMQRD